MDAALATVIVALIGAVASVLVALITHRKKEDPATTKPVGESTVPTTLESAKEALRSRPGCTVSITLLAGVVLVGAWLNANSANLQRLARSLGQW